MLLLLVVCIVAGSATYYLNHISNRGPILASGVIALTAGLILPTIFIRNGYTLALAATCVSYAAMAAKSRIRNLQEMTLCSVLVAILFSLSSTSLVGVGGRLGTIAAITVVIVWGIGTHPKGRVMADEGYVTRTHILRNCIAFLLFMVTGFLLLFQSWQGAASSLTRLLLGLNLTVFSYGLYLHLRDFFRREIFEDSPDNFIQDVWLFPCAVSGTVLTYYLSVTLNLGPVVASGIIGILAALVLSSPCAVITYAAAFAGMSSPSILPSYYHVLLVGVVVWVLYIISRRIYQGFGSRLGTMAAGAVLIVHLMVKLFSVTFP